MSKPGAKKVFALKFDYKDSSNLLFKKKKNINPTPKSVPLVALSGRPPAKFGRGAARHGTLWLVLAAWTYMMLWPDLVASAKFGRYELELAVP